jgi:56kDa selenium binding protein (SBP56)
MGQRLASIRPIGHGASPLIADGSLRFPTLPERLDLDRWREGGKFHIEDGDHRARAGIQGMQGFGAVSPLVTDIDLSMDDKFLYVACWGTGEMRQYDVTDPRRPKLAGSVHVGGIARRTPHVVEWQRQNQIAASLLVIGFGIFQLVNQRHPRVLARIRPTQLGLWSNRTWRKTDARADLSRALSGRRS